MKRREIVKNLAIGGATTGAVVASSKTLLAQSPQPAQPRIEWRMATSWLESLDILFGAVKFFCNRVSELTNGRFTITPFPAGGIAPPLEILDVVQAGTSECGHTAAYYYVDKNPAFAFATVVPFGLNVYQHLVWIQSGGGLEITRKLYADFNTINFLMVNTGIQMGGWFKKEVKTLADMKGLKMRIPGLGGQVMKRLGVKAQNLPPAEIIPALERGGIDAAEWTTPYEDEKLNLNKAAPFYYYPGWHEPGTNYELIINRNAWERLPKEYQEAIQSAAMETHLVAIARYDAGNRLAMQRLLSSGTKFVPYSREILEGARKAAFELYEERASESKSFKEVYEQWSDFRQKIHAWNRVNELSFADFVLSQA